MFENSAVWEPESHKHVYAHTYYIQGKTTDDKDAIKNTFTSSKENYKVSSVIYQFTFSKGSYLLISIMCISAYTDSGWSNKKPPKDRGL